MADPAVTDPTDGDTLTESLVSFTWSAGSDIDWYRIVASWTQTFTLADDTTTTQTFVVDSGTLSAKRLSYEMNLPMDGQTITVTLYWSSAGVSGSAAYSYTGVNQPDYQDSARYHRADAPRWYQCARCGFVYPEDELAHDPYTGALVCLRFDYDKSEVGDHVVTLSGTRRNPHLESG